MSQKQHFDILIKNGRVIDPYNNVDGIADVAILNRKIAGIGSLPEATAKEIIDATGCVITPGLIDMHVHLRPMMAIGVHGESSFFPSGITTITEAGSMGCVAYEGHRPYLQTLKVGVKALLNVCSHGMIFGHPGENVDPHLYDRKRLTELFGAYRAELGGLKLRVGRDTMQDLAPLKEALQLAKDLETNLVVHSTDPAGPMAEVVSLLRKGDVITHIYHNRGSTILGSNGRVLPEIWEARKRGVIFDLGNANVHTSYRTLDAALAENFLPDTFSTDLTTAGLYTRFAVFNILHLMSKFLNLGVSLPEVIRKATANPASAIHEEGRLGCLTPDNNADVAILKEIEKETRFGDCDGNAIMGKRLLKCMLTVKDGDLVYRDIEF